MRKEFWFVIILLLTLTIAGCKKEGQNSNTITLVIDKSGLHGYSVDVALLSDGQVVLDSRTSYDYPKATIEYGEYAPGNYEIRAIGSKSVGILTPQGNPIVKTAYCNKGFQLQAGKSQTINLTSSDFVIQW